MNSRTFLIPGISAPTTYRKMHSGIMAGLLVPEAVPLYEMQNGKWVLVDSFPDRGSLCSYINSFYSSGSFSHHSMRPRDVNASSVIVELVGL